MTPAIRQRIDLTDDALNSPVRMPPDAWTWSQLEVGEAVVVIVPRWFAYDVENAACNRNDVTLTVKYSDKVRDDKRVAMLITCVGGGGHETIPAKDSPNGQELKVIKKMHFTPPEAITSRRRSWPFKEMEPGDAVWFSGPRHFVDKISTTASGYIHPACDRKIRAKRYEMTPDGNRKVLVWCESQ